MTTLNSVPSGLLSTVDATGTLNIQTNSVNALAIDTNQNATMNYVSAQNTFGFKNRIINGAMVIDQRNNGASVTFTNGQYIVDRWQAYQNTTGSFTVGQSTSAPVGFNNSLLVTITSAATSLGTNFSIIRQYVEGYNIADLNWGTANAKTITLSFWVKSSATGTFTGVLQNGNNDYAYGYTYTINSANTWEQKTITVTGPTSGTWGTTNGRGIDLDFCLASATGLTAGSWVTNGGGGNYYYGAPGQTNLFANNGATFYITGVQLEKGSIATPFDYRDYGRELALCQRYYQRLTGSGNSSYGSGGCLYANQLRLTVPSKTTMRASPTFNSSAASSFYAQGNNTNTTLSGLSLASSSPDGFYLYGAATLTTNVPYALIDGTGSYIEFISEL